MFSWKASLQRSRESSHLLTHSFYGCSGRSWTRLKPAAWGSNQVSLRVAGAQALGPCCTVFPGTLAESWARSGAIENWSGAWGYHRYHLMVQENCIFCTYLSHEFCWFFKMYVLHTKPQIHQENWQSPQNIFWLGWLSSWDPVMATV